MKKHEGRKGFTLVELLVVIAIIGLLSTIAFISLNRARGKARDAKRISDVRQLQSALELYYSNQTVPQYPPGENPPGTVVPGFLYNGPDGMDSTVLDTTYVASMPKAPTPPDGPPTCGVANNKYVYQAYQSEGSGVCTAVPCGWYHIDFCLGSAVGGLSGPAVHTATPAGIL